MRLARGFLIAITLWGAGASPVLSADVPGPSRELKDVKVETRPTGVAVTLEVTGHPKYEATLIDSPYRLVVDIGGTFRAPSMRWTSTPEPIKEIRGSQFKSGTARLVVELNRKAAYRVEESPQGLTVLIDPPATAAALDGASPARRTTAPDLPRMPEVPKLADVKAP